MEDFDAEEEDEEALIEQRRQQRLAIVQVTQYSNSVVVLSQNVSSFRSLKLYSILILTEIQRGK